MHTWLKLFNINVFYDCFICRRVYLKQVKVRRIIENLLFVNVDRRLNNFIFLDRVYDFLTLNRPTTSSEYQKFANVCNLSNVATVLHVLNIIQDHKTIVTSILTIHIVGANTEIALFTRYECWLLFYWLPTIFYINLIFVGPELPAKNSFTEISYKSTRKKTVKVSYKKMKYEEYTTRR